MRPNVALPALPAAGPHTFQLQVQSVGSPYDPGGQFTSNEQVTSFQYLITRDDSGDPLQGVNLNTGLLDPTSPGARLCNRNTNPDYPTGCAWPAVMSIPGGTTAVAVDPTKDPSDPTAVDPALSEVVTQGDQGDFAGADAGFDLPDGTYLVSVIADGYKIDGAHFTIGGPNATPQPVRVFMNKLDLPLATVRIQVFEDTSTQGAFDEATEQPNGAGNPAMDGFVGHLADVLGEVVTDWYGNPLCTLYQQADGSGNPTTLPDPFTGPYQLGANGRPVIKHLGGRCLSDADGVIEIGNLGPNRYATTVTPPTSGHNSGIGWIQTSTLEGSHDWDQWTQEGDTGFDTENTVGGEATAAVPFGFVRDKNQFTSPGVTGGIKGTIVAVHAFTPPFAGFTFGAEAGTVIDGPVDDAYISVMDLAGGDTNAYVAPANADGTFLIPHVPDGDYELAVWDVKQDFLIETAQATVRGGHVTDMGDYYLTYWFSRVHGSVFIDTNQNGRRDPGETGLPNQPVQLLSRDNSLQDQGTQVATTDFAGNYDASEAYPLGQFVVEQVYNQGYKTTGVTFQTDNQPDETTLLGPGVDLSTFNLVGLNSRIDWGVVPYAAGENGGIVSTVYYATTRNEVDARLAATEDYESGIPGLTVDLYAPVKCSDTPPGPHEACSPDGYVQAADGSYKDGQLLNQYTTETYKRPSDCVSRGVDGAVQDYPWVSLVSSNPFDPGLAHHECIEGFAMSNQAGVSDPANPDDTSQGLFPGTEVNGNYGLQTRCTAAQGPWDRTQQACADGSDPSQPIPAGDYLVRVEIPNDAIHHRPLFQVEREEDVNIAAGDSYSPQAPPPACAGALHVVDVVGSGQDGTYGLTFAGNPISDVPVDNPTFVDIGGSPYEGQARPLCDQKLVTLLDRHSISTGTFNFFTHVPTPGRFFGIVTDDLTLSTNPNEVFFGEKTGIPNLPIGLYDYHGRLVDNVLTDPNGAFSMIEPSTGTYNCPLPAGPCPNVYRFVADDPGYQNHPNPFYQPAYRTIATPFQLWPNLTLPADLAPFPAAYAVEGPGTGTRHPAPCLVEPGAPQLFAVSKPYLLASDTTNASRTITINGQGFGNSTGKVTLDATDPNADGSYDQRSLNVQSWTDRQIKVRVPAANGTQKPLYPGPHRLTVTTASGASTIDGVSFHLLGSNSAATYTPSLLTVNGPGPINGSTNFDSVQGAVSRASSSGIAQVLVVVFPHPDGGYPPDAAPNPLGAYYENVVVSSPIKLQGVGPGGTRSDGSFVKGSIIDGRGFNTIAARNGEVGASAAEQWRTLVASTLFSGNQTVSEAAVITVLSNELTGPGAHPTGPQPFTPAFKASIDGFTIQGGNELGQPTNINDNGGGPVPNPVGDVGNETPITQGGGIYVNGHAHYLQITNDVLDGNGGVYGGAIRLGTPAVQPSVNNNNNVRIAYDRILHNGGTNLAGAIGIFSGATAYEVDDNDICGNFSAEYGGGISHFGLSSLSSIHDNQIVNNGSYDEGAGVMIAGEPNPNPTGLSAGAGSVAIYNNLIQGNLANDDGGGLRFLQAGNEPIRVYNNMISNNVSTHEGGGVALDDATNLRFYNNTVIRNITTATAATSSGDPAPAGLSDTFTSDALQATLAPSHKPFSDPLLFNNIFWDNRAGAWDINANGIRGIGAAGDSGPLNHWDVGVAGGGGQLTMSSSDVQQQAGDTDLFTGQAHSFVDSPTDLHVDPLVIGSFRTAIDALAWRGDPHFINTITISADVPATIQGNYHLGTNSPLLGRGSVSATAGQAPTAQGAPGTDIEYDSRTLAPKRSARVDIGADQAVADTTTATNRRKSHPLIVTLHSHAGGTGNATARAIRPTRHPLHTGRNG